MILDTNVRLANGTLSQYALEADDDYLVANFARQTDMTPSDQWIAVPKDPVRGTVSTALDGSGGYVGMYTGGLEFFVLTADMIGYLWTNIFNSLPRAAVTLRTLHQHLDWKVYNATLIWPFDAGEFTQQHLDLYSNVLFRWERGTVAAYGRSYSPSYSASYG
jgi:hypothetical protein